MGLLNLDPIVATLTPTLPNGGIPHEAGLSISDVLQGRGWRESVLGMFCELRRACRGGGEGTAELTDRRGCVLDVKPNYPGRSAHVCFFCCWCWEGWGEGSWSWSADDPIQIPFAPRTATVGSSFRPSTGGLKSG